MRYPTRLACVLFLALAAGPVARASFAAPHVAPAAHASAALPAGARADISAALERLETAVAAHDLAGALAVFAPDSELRGAAQARFSLTTGLDSLTCRERLGAIFMRGDTAEAVVCEEITWHDHGRIQADYSWRTRDFAPRNRRYTLCSDRDRNCAQVGSTDLGIDLHPEKGTLSGRSRLAVSLAAPGEDDLLVRLNRGLEVEGLESAAGTPIAFTRVADLIVVPLAGFPPASAGGSGGDADSMVLTIRFGGSLFNETREQGYSQVSVAPEGSFASWVTNWYPHLVGPGSKSRGRITYEVPGDATVASSGRRIEDRVAGDRRTQVFEVDRPLDFSFAAAHYFHKSQVVDGIDVGVYFLEGGDAKADLYIANCAKILAFLHRVYGFYPFDGYAVVELPARAVGTLGGSSEQGMNLFPAGGLRDDEFPVALLSHEIGHSWWGNLVEGEGTPVLDEGLAQMTAVLCVEHLAGQRKMRRFLHHGMPRYSQSALEYFARFAGVGGRDFPLRTLAAGSANAMALHDLADDKGFFVYEMLRETIGDSAFVRGLRRAVDEYARREIRLVDLQRIWEREGGRPLGWFFEQWFGRTGAPEFRMRYRCAAAPDGGFRIEGAVTQVGELYRAKAEVVLAGAGRPPRVETLEIRARETPFRFAAAERPDTVLFDPEYKVLRWTDELRNIRLYVNARLLASRGSADSAAAALAEYVARAPFAFNGHCEAGLERLEAGDLDPAEREFHWVVDQLRVYAFDDPAMAKSELGLGKISDLRGRRAEAVDWYRRALASTDDPPTLAEAAKLVDAPYQVRTKVAADPALLERCVGKYAVEPGFSVEVSLGSGGVLLAATSMGQTFGLERSEGARFTARGVDGLTFEFSGGKGPFVELVVARSGQVFHLRRQS